MTSQEVQTSLNRLAEQIHADNHKWWVDIKTGEPLKRNVAELLMLAVSELAEAMEGDRKDLCDDKLPHRKMFEVELADCLIRILDTAYGLGYNIGAATAEKLEYNRVREDHKHEARLKVGGKKY